jgi:Tfp pilus assembly protein PilO
MIFNLTQLSVISPTEWQVLDFVIFAGLFLLIAVATLIWFFFFRKKRQRRRKHHSERRQLNPTRAEKGGLPPVKRPDGALGENPPPMP